MVLACATPAADSLCVFVTLLDVDAPDTALAAPTSLCVLVTLPDAEDPAIALAAPTNLCVWAISPAAELAACETFAAAMGLATTESK